MACQALPYFSTLSHKRQGGREKFIEYKMCAWFSLLLSETFPILRRNGRDITKNYHRSPCKVPVTPVRILEKLSQQIFEKYSNIKFHENPSTGS